MAELTDGQGGRGFKPCAPSTYLDLSENRPAQPRHIHQGFAVGREPFLEMLRAWQDIGIDHLMISFKLSRRPVAEVIDELAEYVLPHFQAGPVRAARERAPRSTPLPGA